MQSCYECHKVMLQNVQITSGLSILMPGVISLPMPPTLYDKTYSKILYNEFSITQILIDRRQSPDKQNLFCVNFSLSIRPFFWVPTCFPLRNKKNNFTQMEAWKYPLIKLGHTKLGIHWIQIIVCISVYIFAYYLTKYALKVDLNGHRPREYKTFFILTSPEQEISTAHKN